MVLTCTFLDWQHLIGSEFECLSTLLNMIVVDVKFLNSNMTPWPYIWSGDTFSPSDWLHRFFRDIQNVYENEHELPLGNVPGIRVGNRPPSIVSYYIPSKSSSVARGHDLYLDTSEDQQIKQYMRQQSGEMKRNGTFGDNSISRLVSKYETILYAVTSHMSRDTNCSVSGRLTNATGSSQFPRGFIVRSPRDDELEW